jgi:hypothetical protein
MLGVEQINICFLQLAKIIKTDFFNKLINLFVKEGSAIYPENSAKL